jgi:hypothetical protein
MIGFDRCIYRLGRNISVSVHRVYDFLSGNAHKVYKVHRIHEFRKVGEYQVNTPISKFTCKVKFSNI